MEEQYLQDLFGWISSQDATFEDRYSYNDFAYKMQNDADYVNSMYNWIGSVDNTFSDRYTPKQFQAKVQGSETVMEEPKKKKNFFERQSTRLSLRHLLPLRKNNLLHRIHKRLMTLRIISSGLRKLA